MKYALTRREFVQTSMAVAGGLAASCKSEAAASDEQLFDISLAEWSLHRSIFGDGLSADFSTMLRTDPRSVLQGEIDHLDFARVARQEFGIGAVEYVNTFFYDRALDQAYLGDMRQRADDHGVQSLLIMCDQEGALGAPSEEDRAQAVENHRKWLEAAAFLGCHSIRVNAASEGSREEQQRLAADGLSQLAEIGDSFGLNVLVENHGGLSSDGSWLAGVMQLADHPRLGTLPDFGNFRIGADQFYDRYVGVEELMPYALAVSAKANDFDANGEVVETDFERMVRIVLDAGYRGYLGIEYEGRVLSEMEGIRATKVLLERVRGKVAPDYHARQ